MARIFVSYSRKNIDFAKQLIGRLEEREIDCWVDWEGIPPTVDWKKEIEKGVEESDCFLTIVSPDWMVSKICKDELEIAVRNGKRLIPVVPYPIDWGEVPPTLADLNFIFFTPGVDFENQLQLLLTALDTDYDWLKTHRRLQVKALEWERANKDDGFLLRGRDLTEAEEQISINATKDPRPTDLQREYVLKSRQETDRQRQITTGGLVFIILVMIGIIAALVIPRIQESLDKDRARGELLPIKAGRFTFGTADQGLQAIGAIPSQDVVVPEFRIHTYEVTNAQYKLCVKHRRCTVPLEQTDYQEDDRQDHPVVFVTVFQANSFCTWVGLRLLTEVEWERAARDLYGSSSSSDSSLPSPDLVNMADLETGEPTGGLQPVESTPPGPSPGGVYHLVGNAAEWTSTYAYRGGEYQDLHWDGNPETFTGTEYYSTRGGSWSNPIQYISQFNPDMGTVVRTDLGFRCAADAE